MGRDKVRIRFRKLGDLRLVSHHDLLRCFERMLRRADLPFHRSEGFNPKPRLVFALPLPLGALGWHEVADLELDAELPPEVIHDRLARQAPPGLEIVSVRRVDRAARLQVRRVTYRVPLPLERPADLPERIAALLAAPALWIERHRPEHRRLDIRPSMGAIRLEPEGLDMDLHLTPSGMARPEEILDLLGLGSGLDEGTVLERIALELTDEC